MTGRADTGDNARTIEAYEAAAKLYVQHLPPTTPDVLVALIARVAELVGPGGSVLELGSGPGNDAVRLQQLGVRVQPSDATDSFVTMMRERGLDAIGLDALHDGLGGPYDAIFANAMLLHFSRPELARVLERCAAAVRPGGGLVFSVKHGDGEAWTTAKLERPRHFTYWREDPLRHVLARSGWLVESLRVVPGRGDEWLYCECSRSE